MVAIFPAERAPRRHDDTTSRETRSRSRQYDSFVVRLWHDEGSEGMLRVELQHVQAGLSVEAVQVPLDWILPEILSCLQSPRSARTGTSAGDVER